MLPVKSKYKIAKRLGAAIFDKTQTQKFALSEARSKKPRGKGQSDFGKQLLEKQRVRYTYGLSEKQLSNYAKKAFEEKDPSQALHMLLEGRIDSVIYRAGFASTRRAARQIASHGHIVINGQRTTMPSHQVKKGDKISIREGSRKSSLFASLAEKNPEGRMIPSWIQVDINLLTAEIAGTPQYTPIESSLDYSTVFEFYSR